MKSFVASSLLTALGLVTAGAQSHSMVTNVLLNDQEAVALPIGLHRVTTVTFPRPIQAIDGAGMTLDGRTPGVFQLAYEPTNAFFALQALVPGASGNLNVRLAQRTYVLLLSESKTPMLAVNFRSASPGLNGTTGTDAPFLSPTQLLGLLDKARNYAALKQHHPETVTDVSTAAPGSISDFDAFTITLEEVYRFDESDALVFRVTLASKIQREVRYRPGSWAVRVGDRLYPQALADATGVIPPTGTVTAWFVVQGRPDGRRNGLSPQNRFTVLINPL